MYSIFIQTRSTCDEVFLNCIWKDNREFDCCKHFVLTETELGICYTLTMENESLVWHIIWPCKYVVIKEKLTYPLKYCNF